MISLRITKQQRAMTTRRSSIKRQQKANGAFSSQEIRYAYAPSFQSYSSSYHNNAFYRRAPPDANVEPELLHQALMPPSRFEESPITPHANSMSFKSSNHDRQSSDSSMPESNVPNMSATNGSQQSHRRRVQTPPSQRSISSDNNGNGNVNIGTQSSQEKYDKRKKPIRSSRIEISIAVLLWYLLGVLSISTTKVLLSNISPLLITMQQLVIGVLFLRVWIYFKNGSAPHPIPIYTTIFTKEKRNECLGYDKLLLSGTFFTLGFFFTNLSFSGADASFVETIKASEPISSAALAVLWGLEQMSSKEVYSLFSICVGVVISTLGNAHGSQSNTATDGSGMLMESENLVTLTDSIYSSGIVMVANLCFSFRGLYQKLFRASPNGSSKVVDDLNLQYRVHQVGAVILLLPIFLYEFPSLFRIIIGENVGGIWMDRKEVRTFVMLSVINGFAFTHYNYILSRISVVHHAALNCIRRLFAIVVTSIVFSVPITMTSGLGIIISIGGFLMFTHFKVKRKERTSSVLPVSNVVDNR